MVNVYICHCMSICYGIGIRGGLCDDGFLYHHSVHSGSGTCQGPFFYAFPCQDCMEVMGHVTPPYICSLRRGAIVHTWALYLWQGISQVWWAWDNLVNWICFCLDCVLAYGSCQRNKGGGDIRETCMIHPFMSKLYLSKCTSNVILVYLEATNYFVEYNYL